MLPYKPVKGPTEYWKQQEMSVSSGAVAEFEEPKLSKFHWRVVLTAGLGFFTDAYDLFVIGIVTALVGPLWHLSVIQDALLKSSALGAAAIGAILFGALSDKFGRRKLYGLEVSILFFGAILSAISTSFIWLLVSRLIVGFGIGGDYPSSAVVASEHSNSKNRGFLVLLVFGMQALGLMFGPMIASVLIASHMSHEYIWRILAGLGAIPAASVFYLRRTLKESPHFLRTKEVPLEVSRVIHDLSEQREGEQLAFGYKKQSLFSSKWLKCLIGTAGAWFLLDVAFYGNGVSSTQIMKAVSPGADLLNHTIIAGLIFLICALPGYIAAAKYVDRIGRKPLQILGFIMMALTYGAIALIPVVTQAIGVFAVIFGISFFFVNFGPNATTFLIPSEIYPASIRAKAHGISAAVGKVGACIGVFLLPLVLHHYHLKVTMGLMAMVALLGILVTFLIPEMTNQDLEATEVIR